VVTVLVVITGIVIVVLSRMGQPDPVGPQLASSGNPTDHWHAALGVYDCDHWVGEPGQGEGLWVWPYATPQGSPARSGTNTYAGLHSHGDGIIHMEPAVTEESGRKATVGRYFDFGGWDLSSSGYDFLGTKVSNGDDCNGKPGVLKWAVGKWDGNDDVKYVEHDGNPASYKLYDSDAVIIAFVPEDVSIESLGNPPSLPNLEGATGREGSTMDTVPTTASTVPGATTPTTGATTTTAGP
jgi:hypothetical protein